MDFFNNLEPLLRAFWFLAIPVSIIFLIQMVMTFTGTDATDGVAPDFDGDLGGGEAPFQLFSLRNLINFLLGFSWAGISLYETISNHTALIIVAFAVGCLFVYMFFLIIHQVQKLAEDNTFKISDTVGKTGEVYLTIPAAKSGKGKVLISVNGSVRELDAATSGEKIETGALIKVVSLDQGNLLFVEKI